MIRLIGQISHKRLTGKAFISKKSEMKITLEDKTVIPTAAEQILEAGKGFDGLGVVTVKGDPNFIAKNIKAGVKLWGLEGTSAASPMAAQATGVIPPVFRGAAISTSLSDEKILFETSAVGSLA